MIYDIQRESIQIPERIRKAVEYFLSLDETDQQRLMDTVAELQPSLDFEHVLAQFEATSSLEGDLNRNILHLISGINQAALEHDLETSEVSEAVIASLYPEEAEKEDRSKLEDKKKSIANLASSATSVAQSFKGYKLSKEGKLVLENARIITDIRPIFEPKTDDRITSSVIVHELRLAVTRNQQVENIYITVDMESLRKLEQVIKRAYSKDTAIRNILPSKMEAFE